LTVVYVVLSPINLLCTVWLAVEVFTREADTWTGMQAAVTGELSRRQFGSDVGIG